MLTFILLYLRSLCIGYSWPMYKWLLHHITGLCELERICANSKNSVAQTTKAIESSLSSSKNNELKLLVEGVHMSINNSVDIICKRKRIKVESNQSFLTVLRSSLQQSLAYRRMIMDVEALRVTRFSWENEEQKATLLQLWELMMPHVKLTSEVSKQWTQIGFQGEDPATDFRGMGILSLTNLIFFATNNAEGARKVLLESHHPKYGYSYAIVAINITSMLYNMLCKGDLKTHFYNLLPNNTLKTVHFHQLFCHLFTEFSSFWVNSKPDSIMEFNRVRRKFELKLLDRLSDPQVILTPNF